ncbi:hypothetical protein F7725_006683 [Dissostichus mawsoni]|uniref:Uncharacterized protein n=1 Tax=Dissostichus mawsoni TaxID=36200 RepID=A0A7J5XV93_DISMA|nr:hypothetical protein F7725_006683 [Dissostichus mawsoni]
MYCLLTSRAIHNEGLSAGTLPGLNKCSSSLESVSSDVLLLGKVYAATPGGGEDMPGTDGYLKMAMVCEVGEKVFFGVLLPLLAGGRGWLERGVFTDVGGLVGEAERGEGDGGVFQRRSPPPHCSVLECDSVPEGRGHGHAQQGVGDGHVLLGAIHQLLPLENCKFTSGNISVVACERTGIHLLARVQPEEDRHTEQQSAAWDLAAIIPTLCPPSGTAEEKDESALFGPPSSLPLSSTTLYFSTSSQTRQLFILQPDRNTQAETATSSSPDESWMGAFPSCSSLCLYLECWEHSAIGYPCVEDDNDLRVVCLIPPKPSTIASYEFSWSIGTKEYVINTNVSGTSADKEFKDKSYVEEQDPQGYRMTLKGFTDKLSLNTTTFMCKMSGEVASIIMEKEQLVQCSAMFLKSAGSWIVCLLLFFYQTHS